MPYSNYVADLRAAERALPPLCERPPLCRAADPADPRYAEPGTVAVAAVRALKGAGYAVRSGPARPEGVPPSSAYVQTVGHATRWKKSPVVAVWVCRKMTPEESALAAAYVWLPWKSLRQLTRSLPPYKEDQLVADVGAPYLCYAAMRYDPAKGFTFGTFAGRDLIGRYKNRISADMKGPVVRSLQRALKRGVPEPTARPDPPDASEEAVERLLDAYFPLADRRARAALVLRYGLDGGPCLTTKAVARGIGVKSQLHAAQIINRELHRAARSARPAI